MKDGNSKAKASKAVMKAVDKLYDQIPAFEDIFTETSFYIFAAVFTLLSLLLGYLSSKHIKIKDTGEKL